MYRFRIVVLLVLWVMVTVESVEHSRSVTGCPNVRTPLREVRKRRHLAFTEGSNVILTSQIVTAFMTHIPSGWNLATEIDVLFPLPDANFTVAHTQRKNLLHRQKRDLWTRLEDAMAYHNLNGRACVLKSICEAKVFLAPPGKSLVHDILRAIFTLPEMDEVFREEMKGSYEELLTPELCDDIAYCPVSLVHLVLLLNSKS